ncbi:hypothetical protein FRC98_14580 [Lujinxingia vulgaris]|uniref:VWFA domain-containing protein n=1 Tax=Lujinxingia vulgaris TaxID=2600176 RepID=A0A5C6X9M9_9DELT|nr:hypothetical protein [Lujinxingia vulgaris]TXD35894.1 hypothetical protein FRC98_14580 [Lujinxingia vulgaris]
MVKRSLLLLSGLLLLAACSDDVVEGQCDPGLTANPVTGECVARQCDEGQRYNPVDGSCVDEGDNPDDPDDPDDPGDDEDPDYDPDCPFFQDCDSDEPAPWNPPADGSYDPFEPQDPATATYHSCETTDVAPMSSPQFILHRAGDYLLAVGRGADVSPLTFFDRNPHAHVLEEADQGYAGFIVSINPRSGFTTATDMAYWLSDTISAIPGYDESAREGSGRTYRTHDGYNASVMNHVRIPTADTPGEARDKILASIFGIGASDLVYELNEASSADDSGLHLSYKTVMRSDQQVIIVGGITTQGRYDQPDHAARFAIEDLAGGTALAMAGETMSDECVSLTLRDTTEVDIIISMDASGSMSSVQSALSGFAEEFTNLLNEAGVDWRIGVTGVDCDGIQEDEALSYDFRSLWPGPDEGNQQPIPGFPNMDLGGPCRPPSGIGGIGGGDGNNGALIGGGFTRDPQAIADRLNDVSTAGNEYTLTMGMAAIDRSLPRAQGAVDKIRPNAQIILVTVTDEREELVGQMISGMGDSISSSTQAELETFLDPWLGWLARPDIGAIVYGLHWIPGQACATAEQGSVAHGIQHVVEQTGGEAGSVCQPDVTETFRDIANATRDLSSGLRLVGNPYASSVKVDVTDLDGNFERSIPRSAADGFDLDTAYNSLMFYGPQVPETDQRVVAPFLRWNRNVIPCGEDAACPGSKKCVLGRCE